MTSKMIEEKKEKYGLRTKKIRNIKGRDKTMIDEIVDVIYEKIKKIRIWNRV